MTPMSYHSHLKRSLAHPWLAHARSSSYNTPFNVINYLGTLVLAHARPSSYKNAFKLFWHASGWHMHGRRVNKREPEPTRTETNPSNHTKAQAKPIRRAGLVPLAPQI